jgi:uncharacterized protein (TIGR02996 family)
MTDKRDWHSEPLAVLGLPASIQERLVAGGITSVGNLCALDENELLEVRNFGERFLLPVQERLALFGLHLRPCEEASTSRKWSSGDGAGPKFKGKQEVEDEAAFWAALSAGPADDACWLVFADWLEDAGRPEAELVRLFFAALARLNEPTVRDRSRFNALQRSLSWDWWREFLRVWSKRPLHFRVWTVNRGPSEIFVWGTLVSGALRQGEPVVLPLVGGGESIQRVQRICNPHLDLDSRVSTGPVFASAGDMFKNIGLAWYTDEAVGLDIAKGGLIYEAPPNEAL